MVVPLFRIGNTASILAAHGQASDMNTRYGIYDQLNNGRQRRQSSMDDLEATIGGIEAKLDKIRGQGPGYPSRDDMADRMRRISEEIDARQPSSLGRHAQIPLKRDVRDYGHPASETAETMGLVVSELQQIRSEMARMASGPSTPDWNVGIRKEIEALKNGLGNLAREDTLRNVESNWTKLAQRPISGDPVIESMLQRIEGIQSAVGNLPQSQTLVGLEEKIRILANAVDQLSRRAPESNVNQLIQIEDRLDEISRAIVASSVSTPKGIDTAAFERLEARLAALNSRIDEIADVDRSAEINKRIALLSNQIDGIASQAGAPLDQMNRMTSQMEVIAARINDLDRSRPDPAAIASGLEDRLYEIAASLEKNHEQSGREAREIFNELEVRLQELSARLESIDAMEPAADNTGHILAAVEQRFADLSSQLVANQPEISFDPAFAQKVESRLDEITRQLNETSAPVYAQDSDALVRLETQVQNLAAQLSSSLADTDPYAALNPRLEAIEQSLSMNHEAILSAARQAAEDVLAQANFQGHGADSDLAIQLAGDLKALETLTRKSDERNTKTFEAIHDTLLKIVDRLNSVEASKPSAAPAFHREQEAPSKAHYPTGPDLGAPEEMPVVVPTAKSPKLDLGMEAPSLGGPQTNDLDDFEFQGSASVRSPVEAALAAAAAARDGIAQPDTSGKAQAKGGFLSNLTAKLRKQEKPAAELQLAGSNLTKSEPLLLDEPVDPSLVNSPIEPGTGTLDLDAIMKRVRDVRRTNGDGPAAGEDVAKNDFLAAARRAAQAAAADAEILRGKSAKVTKKSESGLANLFQSQRKPIMMAAMAVLLAFAGMQLYKNFAGGSPDTAMIAEPAAAPAIETPQAKPDSISEIGNAESAGPEVRQVEAAKSDDSGAVTMAAPQAEPVAEPGSQTAETVQPAASAPDAAASAPEKTVAKADLPPAEYGPIALREAAASGDSKAQFEIAVRLAEGQGITKSLEAAAQWYTLSADQGFAPAQFRIGSFYEKGLGVERSAQKAKEYYQLAAEQGNASAMHNLAVLYAMGAAGPIDNDSAAQWFIKAAEFGVKDSQYNLGILSAKGLGVPRNLEDSYKWFALAAKAGDKDAATKRDEIANVMRPEQLERARGATELWKAKPVDEASNSIEVPAAWRTDGGQTTATGGADTEQMTKAVRNIQAILNSQGFDAGAPDGKMGSKTKKAIAAYQKANRMTATGEVDDALVKSLLAKVEKPKS